jgi:hypothetical protein
VSDDGTRFVDSTTYNPQGQVTQQRADSGANGFTRQVDYDPTTLRASAIRAGTGSPFTGLQQLTFAYDANGNITSVTDGVNSNQKQCYVYDWVNRLTGGFTGTSDCSGYSGVGTGAYSHSFVYNGIGNIVNNAGGGVYLRLEQAARGDGGVRQHVWL